MPAATARHLGGLCGSWQAQPSDAQQVVGGANQMRLRRSFDILDRRQAVAASVLAPALALLERVVAMLARLAGA
ncbi:MAG: hypothetical protein KA190_12865 [Kofleriaceae bacterium]|nr:hypothetical protein [Kofleriaceae bacterium]